MRKFYVQSFLLLVTLAFYTNCLQAQPDISGVYNASGYFFHPSIPRDFSLSKPLSKIGNNRYVAQLGDGSLEFEFSLDSANNLVDWECFGLAQSQPSGFMTTDNPGGYVYSSSKQPGDSPWVSSIYNNKYDSITHTVYVHCGYSVIEGDTGVGSYTRQVYEKLVFVHPSVVVSSFSPSTGTSGTVVTIKGKYFSNFYSVSFGGQPADTAWAVSDSVVTAIVGGGATGDVSVETFSGTASIPGFTYIPPVVTDTQWVSAGNAGFSQGAVKTVSIAMDNSDRPFVVFSDSLNGYKTRVMKLDNSEAWVNVGDFVSDGASSFTNIVLDNNNRIYVAFIDSANGNNITVKKLTGSVWKTVGIAGFAPCDNIYSRDKVSIAVDGNGNPFVVSAVFDFVTADYKISVYRFDGNSWVQLGNSDIGAGSPNGHGCLAINKKTNVPYVVSDDVDLSAGGGVPQLIVKAYTGGSWITVGSPYFTSGTLGAYFPDIIIDSVGAPLVCVQEDNGRERTSVYKFNGIDWMPVGPKFFSQGHALGPSLAVDKNNTPIVSFLDISYNQQGTVMRYNSSGDNWELVGARGFAPTNYLTQNALAINSSNIPYIAFADKTKGNRATVMHYEFVLPITLINLTANLQKQNVLVNWQTTTELNTSFFNVQRSVDGLHFINIGKIAASVNSNVLKNYNFTDSNIISDLNTSTIYYRLQIVDKDGHFSYSKIVFVKLFTSDISLTFWPNPVNDVLNIKVINYIGDADISIYSMDGKKIKEQITSIGNGSIIKIATSELRAGIYFASVHMKNEEVKEKFIKH